MRDQGHFRDRGLSRGNLETEKGHPLARRVIEEVVPPHFLIPKVTPFTGKGDPESHLKAFRAQMLISGGNDALRCKMFVGTLTGTTLKWFSKIPNGSITTFSDFSRLFMDRFSVNRPKQLQIAYMFDIKQKPEETLKQFLNRFYDASVGLLNPSEEMLVGAFVKGLRANLFCESLIRSPVITLAKVRSGAAIHIETEEAMQRKRSEETSDSQSQKQRFSTTNTGGLKYSGSNQVFPLQRSKIPRKEILKINIPTADQVQVPYLERQGDG